MSDTLTHPDVDTEIGGDITFEMMIEATPYDENQDPNHRAHIVNPPMNLHIWKEYMSAQDLVNYARLMKVEIVALCGFKWVPASNPEKHDICDHCIKKAGELMRGEGE